jgi:hypothetical protein
LRDQSPRSVTQEAVRRWIRGDSVPKPDRLELIVDWLEIDPTVIWHSLSEQRGLNEAFARLNSEQQKALLAFMESVSPPPRN